MDYLWGILKGTPYWVYALFAYLLITGLKARQPQTRTVGSLFLFPLLLVSWAFYSLFCRYEIDVWKTAIWSFSLANGFYFGWRMVRFISLEVNKERKCMTFPGSLAPLTLSLGIFITRYIFGVLIALQPELRQETVFFLLDFVSAGLISGVLLGRLTGFYLHYLKASPQLKN